MLTARDEADLARIAADLTRRQIAFVAIHEPDAPHCGALMAIGVLPGRKEDLRRSALGSLPLLR